MNFLSGEIKNDRVAEVGRKIHRRPIEDSLAERACGIWIFRNTKFAGLVQLPLVPLPAILTELRIRPKRCPGFRRSHACSHVRMRRRVSATQESLAMPAKQTTRRIVAR